MALSLETVKGLCIAGMLFVGLLPALIPVAVQLCFTWIRRRRAAAVGSQTTNAQPAERRHSNVTDDDRQLSKPMKLFVSCLACFGAGVFITTFFLHMIREVRESWEQWFAAAKIESDFPWAELFSVIGFILVMFIEQITILCSHCHRRRRKQLKKGVAQTNDGFVAGEYVARKSHPNGLPGNGRRSFASIKDAGQLNYGTSSPSSSHCVHIHERLSAEDIDNDRNYQLSMIDVGGREPTTFVSNEVIPVAADTQTSLLAVLRAIILLIALCFHSVFEGMAIGLMETQKTTLTLFGAVCIHHAINSFCLGLSVFQSGLRPLFIIILVTLFAVMSPIGIAIGLGVRTAPVTLGRYGAIAILQGLSSGTFLYIVFIEILPRQILQDELHDGDHDEHALFVPHQHQRRHKNDEEKPASEQSSTLTLVSPFPAAPRPSDARPYKRSKRAASTSSSRSAAVREAAVTSSFQKLLKCTCFAIGVGLMTMVLALTGHEHGHEGGDAAGSAGHHHHHNHDHNETLVLPHDHSD